MDVDKARKELRQQIDRALSSYVGKVPAKKTVRENINKVLSEFNEKTFKEEPFSDFDIEVKIDDENQIYVDFSVPAHWTIFLEDGEQDAAETGSGEHRLGDERGETEDSSTDKL